MKTAALIAVVLLLSLGRSLPGQQDSSRISAQGGEPSQGQKTAKSESHRPLTNDSIVKLVKAGLSEDTITRMIETQLGEYSLGVDEVIALKRAGVSEKVITAMLNRSSGEQPATPPVNPTPSAGATPADNPPKAPPASEAPSLPSAEAGDAPYPPPPTLVLPVPEPQPQHADDTTAQHADEREAVRSGPVTIPIENVRRVQVEKFFQWSIYKRAIRKKTCIELVDDPAQADAVLRLDKSWVRVKDDSGIVTCHSNESGADCTGGGVTSLTVCDTFGCTSTTGPDYNHVVTFALYDPKTNKRVGYWTEDRYTHPKDLAESLGQAVGCRKGD